MELIIILPFIVFIILFGLQIFKAIYEAQVKQEVARVRLLSEIQNRANGGIDMPSSEVVQEVSGSIETGGIPILTEEASPPISIKIGICRNMSCGEEL
jgi:hypothetical protein